VSLAEDGFSAILDQQVAGFRSQFPLSGIPLQIA
jgi:hypothetical protein